MRSTSSRAGLVVGALARVGHGEHRDLERHELSAFVDAGHGHVSLELRRRESIAGRHFALREAGGEPALALLGRAVGEGIRHHAPLRAASAACRRRSRWRSAAPRRCRRDRGTVCVARNGSPRRRRSSPPAIRRAPGCGWPPPCCRRRVAAAFALSAECRAGSARGGRPRARSHKPARIRRPCLGNRESALRSHGRTTCRDRCAGRSDNKTAPSRPARSRSRPAPSLRTAAAAADGIAVRSARKISPQVSSVLPSTAATNWPVWSVGVPVRRVGLPVRLLVLGASAADHFRAADQDARIDAESPSRSGRARSRFRCRARRRRPESETAAAEPPPPPLAIVLDIVAAAEIIPTHFNTSPDSLRRIIAEARAGVQPRAVSPPPDID